MAERARCRLFHKWGKWGEVRQAESRTGLSRYWYQTRSCDRCGKTKLREV